MTDVVIIGIGQTDIGEHWDRGLRQLAVEALFNAMQDAGLEGAPDALFVSNMLASRISAQTHLGALIADFAGWSGIEATTVEAACASGGAAFQAAVRAVASGMVRIAAVCGVEKMMDATPNEIVKALATAADADFEGVQGATFVALNALIMQRYMYEYKIPHHAFEPFPTVAHQNAVNNPHAMYRYALKPGMYEKAPMIADPLNRFDCAPICDGAAAVVLCSAETARELGKHTPVKVLASVTATDALMATERDNMLDLKASRISAHKAYEQAGLSSQDIDVFEVHDAFSSIAVLSLEAAGFAEPGRGVDLATNGDIAINGRIPISTMGGLKARGHPIGATGVYELVDLVTQLRGDAGENQVKGAEIGMTQNIGGTGGTIVTHILGVG